MVPVGADARRTEHPPDTHPRTGERLLALLLLSQGPPYRCTSQLCKTLGRDVHTVLQWAHDFNAWGLAAWVYRHPGGSAPRRHALAPLLGEVLEQGRIDAASPICPPKICTAPQSACRFP